jgi:hypothetical protein
MDGLLGLSPSLASTYANLSQDVDLRSNARHWTSGPRQAGFFSKGIAGTMRFFGSRKLSDLHDAIARFKVEEKIGPDAPIVPILTSHPIKARIDAFDPCGCERLKVEELPRAHAAAAAGDVLTVLSFRKRVQDTLDTEHAVWSGANLPPELR